MVQDQVLELTDYGVHSALNPSQTSSLRCKLCSGSIRLTGMIRHC